MSEQLARQAGMSARALASLALLCAGAWLVPSGIAIHVALNEWLVHSGIALQVASHDGDTRWIRLFMSTHNTASLLFVAAAVLHVTLNWKALTRYVRAKVGEYVRFKRELVIAVLGVAGLVLLVVNGVVPEADRFVPVHEASYYTRLDRNMVRCDLCPRSCVIAPGQRGVCRVRENSEGRLYSVVYGRPCTVGKEPIEKAPFYHFLPGRKRLTLATAGCNQSCRYCQNWELSQSRPEELRSYDLPPDRVVELAEQESTPIICLTYSEPVVFFEYMCDIARAARPLGLRTAVVTGGYINPEPMRELCGLVDAIKIDLKGFTDDFYRDVCGSSLEPVLEACRIASSSAVHLELVNLVVPAHNDDSALMADMCRWIADSLGRDIPVHFTRFSPAYRLLNAPSTPLRTLERAAEIAAEEGLNYVYVGNVPGHRLQDTRCPSCDSTVISRRGFTVDHAHLEDGRCGFCDEPLAGIWQ